jgi:hypothetical protein
LSRVSPGRAATSPDFPGKTLASARNGLKYSRISYRA